MAKKLRYFDLHGLGESIRYILHYGEVAFEDVRHDRAKWAEDKTIAPFGQLPLFEDGDKGCIHQSLAIARYVGHSFNLSFGDPFKDAQLDAMALMIYDVLYKMAPVWSDPVARDSFLKEAGDFYFSRFEKQIKENDGFLFGELTWVDFVLVGIIECYNLVAETSLVANYPNMQELVERIHSYNGVKKYVAARKPYKKHSHK